jgi:SAM-dependent methyltransferase
MTVLVIILIVLIVCFGSVLLFGAPYLPTLRPQVKAALELADLKKGDTLLELGCGDGKVVKAAAKRGLYVIGYELNPLLAVVAWLRTRRYASHVQIIWGDFWNKPWPEADAIFVFLLPKYMLKLDNVIKRKAQKPVKLLSFAFLIPDREPDGYEAGVYLYKYD